jgi:hypothetical protein
MTRTREVERYGKIARRASKLFNAIDATMADLPCDTDGMLSAEWAELHDLMKLAHVISATAARYEKRARIALDAPVPFVPADGLRDLDAAVKADNPGHAIYSGAPGWDVPF